MNKIYKVIYSKVRQCYVVVSEIAKSHGRHTKSSVAKSSAVLTAAVLIALGSFSIEAALFPATADAAIIKTKTSGSNFVGVERTDGLFKDSDYANHDGQGAHGDNSITIGLKAIASEGTITIGDRDASTSLGSVYVGRGPGMPTGKTMPATSDNGYWATSVGYQSDATGYGSIAIGSNATANNSYDKDSTGHGIQLRVPSGDGSITLNGKPDIQRASVAIGYGASADNGNIAIGSYSDASTDLRTATTTDGKEIKSYLTDKKADSYVSVGKSDALRRISNVADGAAATDVATVGQLQALSNKVGVYDAGFGIKIDSDTNKKTNTISLNRNLGTNLDKTGHVHLDVSETGLVLGTVVDGAPGTDVDLHYGATGDYAVTVGGGVNTASGKASVVIDGTTNDYTKAPKSVKKKDPYTSAYYNRLVKVADGIDDHDVVVMEQLKQYAEKDASNIGNNIKVYKTDANGNVQLDKDKKPIEDKDATTTTQNGSKDAWGKALGAAPFTAGTATTVTNASTSDRLVAGKTLYDYDKPTGSANYVNVNNTTGQNLSALDAQVKANADELNKPNHNIKYYSVNEKLPKIAGYTNEGNDGAKGRGSIAAGFNTHADGIASTVAGSYSGVINTGDVKLMGHDFRGATALSYGTFNVNQSTAQSGVFSGVANSIVGQANATTDSNAAIIYGAGNTVTNSYRAIDPSKFDLSKVEQDIAKKDAAAAAKDLQEAVPTSGGQVMVMGGGNNVDSAYRTQVVGVGNTVKGNQVQNAKGEWVTDTSKETAIKGYDKDKSSQYNYVDGFSNEVINGKHDYVIGANNKLSGDSYDDSNAQPIKRSNRSNIVIGDNHTLTREQNTVIIGSSDTENTQTKARDAVIIGHNANATNDTGADNAVAIGRSATATGGNAVTIGVNTSAGENSITIGSESSAISGSNIAIGRYARVYGDKVANAVALGQMAEAHVADGVAIGSGSIATVKGNSVEGYDPTTGEASRDTTATWQATNAAVSIGKADGTVTRQINGVAAGTKETDAVNVAQLKKLGDNTVQYDLNTNKGKITLAGQNGTTITNVKSALDGAKDADGKDATIATATGDALKNAANLGDLKNVYNEVNAKAEKANGSHTALTVEGGKVAGTADGVYTGDNILLHATTDATTGKVTYDLKLNNDIMIGNKGKDGVSITGPQGEAGKDGIDGKVGISGKDGKDAVSISGKDGVGHIGLTGPAGTNGKDGADGTPGTSIDITVKNGYNTAGQDGKDGINGEKGVDGTSLTRVVYEDKTGEHQIATMEDGMKYAGDNYVAASEGKAEQNVINKKLNNQLDIIGGADSTKLTEKNIGVNSTTDGKLKVQLAKDLTGITSISNQKTEGDKTTGAKIELNTDGTTTVSGGDVNVSNNKITNVGSGIEKDDAGNIKENSKTNAANIGDVQTIAKSEAAAVQAQSGKNITVGSDHTVNLNDKITLGDESDKTKQVSIDGNAATITAGDGNNKVTVDGSKGQVVVGGDSGVKIDGQHVTNLKNTTWTEGKYISGQAATEDQLHTVETNVNSKISDLDSKIQNVDSHHTEITVEGGTKAGTDGYTGESLKLKVTEKDGQKTYDLKLNDQINVGGKDGKDGHIGVNGADGKSGVGIDGKDGISIKGKDGEDGVTIKGIDGKDGVNGAEGHIGLNGKDGMTDIYTTAGKAGLDGKDGETMTRIVYKDPKGTEHQTATLDDGLKFTGDSGNAAVKLNNTVQLTGGAKEYASGSNIGVVASQDEDNAKMEIKLAKDLKGINSIEATTINATTVNAGNTKIDNSGVTIGGNSDHKAITVQQGNVNMGGNIVTGVVTDAQDASSAANVGYVNGITSASNEQIYHDMNMQYNHVENDISRAAAGSNALAALHPMQEFDPDDKAQFALGYGHYRNSNAGAVGAFYQPDENSMVNFGVSFGNGDAGINAGVTFKFGPGGSGHHALTKTQMAKVIDAQSKEIDELKKDNADKDKRIDALEQKMTEILAKLDKSKD